MIVEQPFFGGFMINVAYFDFDAVCNISSDIAAEFALNAGDVNQMISILSDGISYPDDLNLRPYSFLEVRSGYDGNSMGLVLDSLWGKMAVSVIDVGELTRMRRYNEKYSLSLYIEYGKFANNFNQDLFLSLRDFVVSQYIRHDADFVYAGDVLIVQRAFCSLRYRKEPEHLESFLYPYHITKTNKLPEDWRDVLREMSKPIMVVGRENFPLFDWREIEGGGVEICVWDSPVGHDYFYKKVANKLGMLSLWQV